MNAVRHTSVLKIVLIVAVLAVLYALFAPAARGAVGERRFGPPAGTVAPALATAGDPQAGTAARVSAARHLRAEGVG